MTEIEGEYISYYSRLGITPIILTPEMLEVEGNPSFLEEFIRDTGIEGFIIGGGNGIDPQLWGEEKKYDNRWSEPRQKLNEWILKFAETKRMPVLGICTGLHVMNVYFNGKLVQNIPAQTASSLVHSPGGGNPHTPHEIIINDEKMKSYFGLARTQVNSYHSQGITPGMVADALIVWAACPDGTIEALYHPKLPFAGVTWHPERDYASPDKEFNIKLVKMFVRRELVWR